MSPASLVRSGEEYLHDKVNIKQKIEVPTLFDQRIAKYVLELHGVDILMWCQISNPGQLDWRRNALNCGTAIFLARCLLYVRTTRQDALVG